jgi:hypothetical protein
MKEKKMIEFTLKVKVDSQDEMYAYNQLRQALQFSGLDVQITDEWSLNTREIDPDVAALVAAEWAMFHDSNTVDKRIKFRTTRSRWEKAAVAAHKAAMVFKEAKQKELDL